MKKLFYLLISVVVFASCEELFNGSDNEDGLTNSEIIEGLKTALEVGTDTSVIKLNVENAFLNDTTIKIAFPEEASYVQEVVESIPIVGKTLIEALIEKMNHAAEDAADEAGSIFKDAITSITISDGLTILNGDDDAATEYLKEKTYDDLKEAFKPDIKNSLELVGADEAWEAVMIKYNLVASEDVETDLAEYVTEKALDGVFIKIAGVEKDIREDPWAWAETIVGEILEKIFGS